MTTRTCNVVVVVVAAAAAPTYVCCFESDIFLNPCVFALLIVLFRYLASNFDSGMSHINQSTTYMADDRMGARSTSFGGGRRQHSFNHTSYGAAAGGGGNRGYY